jgi:hypothetical protein
LEIATRRTPCRPTRGTTRSLRLQRRLVRLRRYSGQRVAQAASRHVGPGPTLMTAAATRRRSGPPQTAISAPPRQVATAWACDLRLCAPRGIRTPNRQLRSLVLCVDLVRSSRIWPAHVGGVVDLDGSRPVPSDRLDDQTDDQARQAHSTDLVGESKGLVSGALSTESRYCRACGARLERQPDGMALDARQDRDGAHWMSRTALRQSELLALACVRVVA